jgi:uncharacterized cupin superfamily protein
VAGPNLFEPEFDGGSERPGFASRRARLGRQAGAERLGASLYELPPGHAAWPYHSHLANEELLIVVRGRPQLRGPDGWRQLVEGELVSFPIGERGAHQIVNRTDEPVRVLLVSEMNAPDITLYPDSGKVGAFGGAPGSRGDGLKLYLPRDAALDYWEGEEPPGP